jgi:hypothetical protein
MEGTVFKLTKKNILQKNIYITYLLEKKTNTAVGSIAAKEMTNLSGQLTSPLDPDPVFQTTA